LPPIWDGLKQQIFLGDEQFIDKAITQIDIVDGSLDLREVPRMQRRKQAKSLSGYEEHFSLRNDAIVNVYVSGDYLMKAIADRFKLHYSIVSRVIRKAEDA
jgi:putative transposase